MISSVHQDHKKAGPTLIISQQNQLHGWRPLSSIKKRKPCLSRLRSSPSLSRVRFLQLKKLEIEMAYRRKHTSSTSSPFFDDSIAPIPPPPPPDDASPTSLAAQAMRASSAHRDSSLSTAYGESAYRESANRQRYSQSKQVSPLL